MHGMDVIGFLRYKRLELLCRDPLSARAPIRRNARKPEDVFSVNPVTVFVERYKDILID